MIVLKLKMLGKGNAWKFLLEDVSPAFANALRRIMVTEIPILAIDSVDFYDNTSALFDEIIAHRLAMIPLSFDPKKFNLKESCKCGGKGCPLCEVTFVLEKKGPSTAYSRDMKSTDKHVKPISGDFPVVKLLENHNIKLEAKAVLGFGKDHAKWQAANVTYLNYPYIEVKKPVKNLKSIVDQAPKGVLEIKNRKLAIADPFKADEAKVVEDISDGALKVKSYPGKFLFRVESVSGIDPKYIIAEAANVLENKGKQFREELKNLK